MQAEVLAEIIRYGQAFNRAEYSSKQSKEFVKTGFSKQKFCFSHYKVINENESTKKASFTIKLVNNEKLLNILLDYIKEMDNGKGLIARNSKLHHRF